MPRLCVWRSNAEGAPCLRPAANGLSACATGASSISAPSGSTTSPAHPAFRNAARTIAALYDLKADPAKRELFTFEENGERIGLQWLRCRTPRGSRAAHARHEGDRRCHLRADRPLARSCRRADHRPRHAAATAQRAALRLRRQSDPLLRSRAQERSLSVVCGDAAVRHPRPRNLYRRGARRSDPAGGGRRRFRRHRLRHENAGDRRDLRRRSLYRQSHRHRRQPQGREHHRRDPQQRARRFVLGARALRAPCARGGRLSAELPLRRERRRAGVRPREDSVGARFPAQQRRVVAPHLYRDAGQRLSEPAVQHPLLGQDGT